jgi:hypothetical protein
MRERISYYSDGLKLSGILSTPDNSQGKRFLVSCLCQVS